ncbi:hypothetical protein [Bacillus phage SWEP1]|nr:hypothetical protein [Bacillus phage SWEP1]
MAYDYESNDGLCKSNNAEFIHTWNETGKRMEEEKRQWISDLRSQGVKAAHPDDGWVDREKDTVFFCYPHFNDYPQIGDTIALGWSDKWRLVKVVNIVPCHFNTDIRYAFESIEPEKEPSWWEKLLSLFKD